MKKGLKYVGILFVVIMLASVATACNLFGGSGGSKRTSYVINAVLDDQNKTISAKMDINYFNAAEVELDKVMFHLYPNAYRQTAEISPISDLKIDEAYPNGISYGDIIISKLTVGETEQTAEITGSDQNILAVNLPKALKVDSSIKISIDFTLKLANVRHRLGYYGKTINLGNWYPIACVYKNGEFDQTPYSYIGDPFYSEIADYDVTITTPMDYTTAGSGTTLSSVPDSASSTLTTKFSGKKMRDFALVIGELTVVSETVGTTKVNYYYNADTRVEQNMKTAVDALITFSNLFGAYPYDTLSVVKTSFLQGGMEYPGLVYISDALNASSYCETIIHEIAHQWWACVVGNNQNQDAWLDEGLCEYSTALFYEANPSYDITLRQRMAGTTSGYMLYLEMHKRNGKDNTSMNRKLTEYSGEMEYAYLTYAQGEILFNAVRELIGKEAFLSALRSYYKNNKFKIATPEHMIGELEKASGRPLKAYFDSWTEGNTQAYAG